MTKNVKKRNTLEKKYMKKTFVIIHQSYIEL